MNTGFLVAPPPHLPRIRWYHRVGFALGAVAVQMTIAGILLALPPGPRPLVSQSQPRPQDVRPVEVPRLVFVAPRSPVVSGGGGGGGNRQDGPVRKALGPGRDDVTLRTRPPRVERPRPSETTADLPSFQAVELDARPLSGGWGNQIGLPVGGVSTGTSSGPGSGGGVGSGRGTGIGPGEGPGIGPGSGGGFGGGAYRPGGAVTSPVLIRRTVPTYTLEALRDRIEGTVWLETVIGRDGRPTAIRVLRPLDPGLDTKATEALAEWRFEPGRLAGKPVDVVVSVAMDFRIR